VYKYITLCYTDYYISIFIYYLSLNSNNIIEALGIIKILRCIDHRDDYDILIFSYFGKTSVC